VASLINRYLTKYVPGRYSFLEAQRRNTELTRWKLEIGHLPLAALNASHIAEVRDKMLTENTRRGNRRSPTSVRRALAVLSHVFTVAHREWETPGENPVNRIQKPKLPRGRVRFLDKDEMARLLKACHASPCVLLAPLVVLAISTGARRGELLKLKWSNIDWVTGQIRLEITKNGYSRAVPLAGRAHALLTELFQRRQSDYVFGRRDGQAPMDMQKHWQRAMVIAGLEDFRFHDLRHTAASYLAMNGATLIELSAILGHRTLQMVQRYSHLSEQHTADVVRKMNERIFEPLAPGLDQAPAIRLPDGAQTPRIGVGVSAAQSDVPAGLEEVPQAV
jgi:integrase